MIKAIETEHATLQLLVDEIEDLKRFDVAHTELVRWHFEVIDGGYYDSVPYDDRCALHLVDIVERVFIRECFELAANPFLYRMPFQVLEDLRKLYSRLQD